MDDRNEGDSRSAKLGMRMREAAAQLRQRGEVSLRGVRRSVGEVGDRLKSSHASKQVGSAVESWRVIKKAADAQRRGNHAMAYRLLEPKVQADPSDTRLVVAFWSAALACDRAEDAVSFMIGIIRRLASSGKPDRAGELWTELRSAVPSAQVGPSALVRIAAALEVGGERDALVQALRDAADSDSKGLSPGLAARIAEMARELDPPTALRAVHTALQAPDLHQAKRMRLERIAQELVAAGAGSATGADVAREHSANREVSCEPRSGAEWMEAAADEVLDAAHRITRFRDLKLMEAMPTKLLAEGVALQLAAGRTGRIEYAKIDGIAVAEVTGLAEYPVVVIDLLLNWSSEQDPTLRVVRLRSDGFDPRMLFEAPDDRAEAFRSFLSELLERCDAVPLPNLDSAQAVDVRTFETLEAYARDVLQVES